MVKITDRKSHGKMKLVREKGRGRRTNYDGVTKESLTFTGYDVYVQTGSGDCHTSLDFRGDFYGSQSAKVPT